MSGVRTPLRTALALALIGSAAYWAFGTPSRWRSAGGEAPAARAPATASATQPTRPLPAPPERAAPSSLPAGAAGAAASATAERVPSTCPPEMVLASGSYCTSVAHTCRRWLDDEKLPFARCGDYAPEARCTGPRKALAFCIDRYEYTRPSERLPMNYASFVEASRVCAELGKRVCTEDEWVFACEGEEMRPYPYGFSRAAVCNQDREDLYESNAGRQVLRDHRHAAGSHPDCTSPFGVVDMAGNLDEPVLRESQRFAYPYRNALKGGWWMAARNRCRPATTAHDDHYKDIQVGVRCCRDLKR